MPDSTDGHTQIAVSARTGDGLRALLARIARVLDLHCGVRPVEMPVLTRTRHVQALESAREELVAFRTNWCNATLPASVAAVHVRAAVTALDGLIGAVDVEDVLGRVFETFCVGK